MEDYKTIAGGADAELAEKKSVFRGCARHAETEAQAREALDEIKRKYPGAGHYPYAYILREGSVIRFSDDGEPQSTAGRPILRVLEAQGLRDALVAVPRVFGGIKLGAAGLTRAYGAAAALTLNLAQKGTCGMAAVMTAVCGYGDYGRVNDEMARRGAENVEAVFGAKIALTAEVRARDAGAFAAAIIELTDGRVKFVKIREKRKFFNDIL